MPSCSIGFCVAITKNGCFELEDVAGDADRAFLHRFEQGRLRLRRGAVDFVGQADLREDRALLELETRGGRRASSMTMFVPRMSAGIRSGVNWMREKLQVERLGQRAHQQRLAQARHAFEQAVAADEQAGEHAVDDVVVADDHAAELLANGLVARGELGRLLFDGSSADDSCRSQLSTG